jgi:aryl-alcohol dehydrogenase
MRQFNFQGSRIDGTTALSLPDGQTVSSHFFGQSSFAKRAVVRGCSAVKVDRTLPLDILCSLGCGMQTGAGTILNVLKPELGSSIAIFGVGAVGMAGVMAARLTPAVKIIAVDVLDSKLNMARELGATHTLNPNKINVVSEIKKLTGSFGVERAFDATGRIDVIRNMIDCASPGALVVTVGAPPMGKTIEIEVAAWLEKGVSYMGAHQGSSFPKKVQLVFFLSQLRPLMT